MDLCLQIDPELMFYLNDQQFLINLNDRVTAFMTPIDPSTMLGPHVHMRSDHVERRLRSIIFITVAEVQPALIPLIHPEMTWSDGPAIELKLVIGFSDLARNTVDCNPGVAYIQ